MDKKTIIKNLSKRDAYGRGSFKFLIKASEKDTSLKNIIENIENFSVEEINNLQVRKWIKKQLLILHKEMTIRSPGSLSPEEIANIMIKNSKTTEQDK